MRGSRIVIDARNIDTSTGHYVQHLLRRLNDLYSDEFRFVALVPSKTMAHWKKSFPKIAIDSANEKAYSVAEQTTFVSKLTSHQPDLVHFTMPQQPFLWVRPAVTTIHDLTLVRYDNIDMNKYLYKVRKGVFISLLRAILMRARAIITPTHYVKSDIVDYAGEAYASKIFVTHEAGEPLVCEPEPIKKLVGKQFLFYVGNAYPYKNIACLVDAFAILKQSHPDLHLVLAGKKDGFYQSIVADVKERALRDVHFLGFISPGEKRWALQHCLAYTSASLSEGFNITLLEAMYDNTPVVVSRASCHPEVGDDAALYFDPNNSDDLVNVIERLINNPSLRNELIQKGTRRVKNFSWERMADETVAVYRRALKK